MDTCGTGICRVCGLELVGRSWEGGECDRCGSVSVTTLPTAAQLDDYYRERFNHHYKGGGKSGGRNLVRYARRYLEIVRAGGGGTRLIDVGSSKSPFPNLAARAGFRVTVMDYTRLENLDEDIHFIAGNLNSPDLLAEYGAAYDTVTAWAVLEHVPDPPLAAQILAGMCRPGGRIFLSTPEIGTFLTRYAMGHSNWFQPPMHLHLVSPRGIQTLFEPQGCRLIRWGRLELNPARFAARYGRGLTESLAGWPMWLCRRSAWQKRRDRKVQRFQGIAWYVLQYGESAAGSL